MMPFHFTCAVFVFLMALLLVQGENTTYDGSNSQELAEDGTGCQKPLGMESGKITDKQLSASSQYNANHGVNRARLRTKITGNKQGAWVPRTNDANQWLQIDSGGQYTKVKRVGTQGRFNSNQWVITYKLQYSDDGVNFQYYREQGQTADKVFSGNSDQNTILLQTLNPPITAPYIRFRPVTWHNRIAMRVELYGCTDEPDNGVYKWKHCVTGQWKSPTNSPIPSITKPTWLQTPSIVQVKPGHYQALGRTINARYLKERLRMKETNIDAATRETMTFVKQLDIYADIFYIEAAVVFYGIKTIKIYAREIVASKGSAIVSSMPDWIQNYANAVGRKPNGDGTDGENGKNGVDGPQVDVVCDVINGEFDVSSKGGHGHKGQDGGDGRPGSPASNMRDPYSNPLWCIGNGYFRFRQTYQEASRRARERCNGQNRSPITGHRGGNGMRGGNAGTPGNGGKAGSVTLHYRKLNGRLKSKVCAGTGAEPAKNGQGGSGGKGGTGVPGRRCRSWEEYRVNADYERWQCSDNGRPGAARGSPGRNGVSGQTASVKGNDGMASVSSVRSVRSETLNAVTRTGFPKELLLVIRRQAVDLLLGNQNDKKGKDALQFIVKVTEGREDVKDIKNIRKDAQRMIAFVGKKGFDIFGKSKFFVPLVKWETFQKDVNEIKAAAEAYETAFNNVIQQQTNQQNFQQMASLMSKVAAQQIKAEKDRLIQARIIDESEKWLYVEAINEAERQMTDTLKKIYSSLKIAHGKARKKLAREHALAILQGATGFAGAIAGKDPFAAIDTAVSISDYAANKACLKSLGTVLKSAKKWLQFGKYKPLKDSSDLDFNKVDVTAVPDILQAKLDINKEKFTEDLVCLLEEASRPSNIAALKAEIESYFILGSARIDMIAKVMDLDNGIGGHDFDIPLLAETEKAIKDLSKPPDASISNTLRQTFMENLLATYRELERSFMENLYKLRKALGFRTLWELDDMMSSFRRIASESALGTGKLNGAVELTKELTKLSQIIRKTERCFTKLRSIKTVQKWSFDNVNDKQMFEEIKQGSTRFNIGVNKICDTCYNARLIRMYIELYGPQEQPESVSDKVHLRVRHLSRAYFRAGDGNIKSYHQPITNYRDLKFDRFAISDRAKCRSRKKDGKSTLHFCVNKDDTRLKPMCSHSLNGQTGKGFMLGKEECTSPSGYYELKIPVDKKLLCTDPKMRDTNCKDLDLTKFTKMNVWVYYIYWSTKYPKNPDDPVCSTAQKDLSSGRLTP